MQQKADVFEQVEGPCSCRALVDLLLVFGLMRVDAFKDAQPPEKQRERDREREKDQELFFCDITAV